MKLLPVLFLFLTGCIFKCSNLQYVVNNEWIYEKGYKVGEGDLLEFSGELYELRGDTILRKNHAVATVVRVIPSKHKLIIKSINSRINGIYYDTGLYLEE
jgi:hypothetical protein